MKEYYQEYRQLIPKTVINALSFRLLFLLVPLLTLYAYFALLLGLDLGVFKDFLNDYIKPEYAKMFIQVLNRASLSSFNIFVLFSSFTIVVRGIRQITDISIKLFHQEKKKGIFYFLDACRFTALLFIFLIGMSFLLALDPISKVLSILTSLKILKFIVVFFFVVMLYFLLYRIVVPLNIPHTYLLKGALFTGIGITILYYGLMVYFYFSNFQNVYGPLSFILVLLFVFDLSSEIFYLGMYVIYVMNKGEKHETKTNN